MSRQAQRVHKKFYRLKLRANFFVGAELFEKTSFCTARPLGGSGIPLSIGGVKFVAPWTVVRSDEYVNKKLIAAKLSDAVAKTRPDSWDLKEGQTHFYNDGCPGGHLGETGQPHSDNKTSGPSS